MLHHAGMLIPGAQENKVGIFLDPDRMSWRPTEAVPCAGDFLSPVSVAYGQPSFHYIPPVRGSAQIVLKPSEQRGNIQSCRKGKMLSAHRAVSSCITKTLLLAS